MNTPTLSKLDQEYMSLNSKQEKFDYLINLFDEYSGYTSMALDPGVVFNQEEEEEFEELGDFIFVKMKGFREELFT